MRLTNIGMINWHTYAAKDVPVIGDVIGVIGDNGAGKSTLLDALYVVLRGGVDNVKLNKRAAGASDAAEEKRSIHSYCLGKLNANGDTLREEANTYLLAGFEDPNGKKPPVTLLLAFHASVDSPKQHLEARCVIRGALIKVEDILKSTPEGKVADVWNDTRTRIEARLKLMGGATMTPYSSAKEYELNYLQALMYRGQIDVHKQYLKNLDNALAFTKVGSATEFIQKYVLADDPIDIQSLRSSVITFNTLVAKVNSIREQIALLEGLITTLGKRKTAEQVEDIERAVASMAQAANSRRENRQLRQKLATSRVRHAAALAKNTTSKAERSFLNGKLRELEERKRALADPTRTSLLRRDLAEWRGALDQRLARLLGADGVGRLAHAIRYKLQALDMAKELHGPFVALNEAVNGSGHAEASYLPADADKADLAFRDAVAAIGNVEGSLKQRKEALLVEHHELKARFDSLRSQIEAAERNRIEHDRDASALVKALADLGVHADVLCDIVEIADESWRDAVESLLGPTRDIVFVAPGDYDKAACLLQANKRVFGSATIANTVKLARHVHRSKPGTITEVVVSDNPLASALIDKRFGGTQLAEALDDFKKDGRWLLRDGMSDDGTSTRALRPTTPKIGKNAVARLLPILKEQASHVAAALSPVAGRLNDLTQLIDGIERMANLARTMDDPDAPFARTKEEVADKTARMRQHEADIEAIEDAADSSGVDLEIEEMNEQIAEMEAAQAESVRIEINLGRDIEDIERALNGNDAVLGSALNLSKSNANYRQTMLALRFPGKTKAYHVEFNKRAQDGKDYAGIRSAASTAMARASDFLKTGLGQAQQEALICIGKIDGARNALPEEFSLMDDILPWAVSIHDELKNNELLGYQAMLEKCRAESDDLFRSSFVNALASKFADVRNQIANLNAVIRNTEFLNEVYKINVTPAPGREPFHVVVAESDAVNIAMAGASLFKMTLDEKVASAMEAIKDIIFAPDGAVDLEQYADYRLYFSFELEMVNAKTKVKNTLKSRNATGSGGEVQTPYYICMMAAMSNVYYGGPYKDIKKGDGGLCLAIFDEAFSNMDEKVTAQVIDLGRALGLQMIICGPSSKKVTMQRNCETVLTVVKTSDARSTVVYPTHIAQLAREELKGIDPANKNDMEIAEMMEARRA